MFFGPRIKSLKIRARDTSNVLHNFPGNEVNTSAVKRVCGVRLDCKRFELESSKLFKIQVSCFWSYLVKIDSVHVLRSWKLNAWTSSKDLRRWWPSLALSFSCMFVPWKTHLFSDLRLEKMLLKGSSVETTLAAYQTLRSEIEVRYLNHFSFWHCDIRSFEFSECIQKGLWWPKWWCLFLMVFSIQKKRHFTF